MATRRAWPARCIRSSPSAASARLRTARRCSERTAAVMIEATAEGDGRVRAGGRPLRIEIVDAGGGIASVVVRSEHYHEYLHLVETPGGWQIVNALWRWSNGHGPRA